MNWSNRPEGPTRGRRAEMKVLQFIVGAILLLPGICSIGFMVGMIPTMTTDLAILWVLWLACFGLAWLGIWMIRRATGKA